MLFKTKLKNKERLKNVLSIKLPYHLHSKKKYGYLQMLLRKMIKMEITMNGKMQI